MNWEHGKFIDDRMATNTRESILCFGLPMVLYVGELINTCINCDHGRCMFYDQSTCLYFYPDIRMYNDHITCDYNDHDKCMN